MANLEKTMQAALSFTGGGEELDNSPWIVHILLGRMIRGRTEIGRAIKSLAKFQRREIICWLVVKLWFNPCLGKLIPPSYLPR
jgi:hypothetical protein